MDGGEVPGVPVPRVDARVVRVRRPQTIADRRIRSLIHDAVRAAEYPRCTPRMFYEFLARNIASDSLGLFIGFKFPREWYGCGFGNPAMANPAALAVALLPSSPLMLGAQVALAYSRDRELSKLVGARLTDWLKQTGHDRFFAVDFLRGDHNAYVRVFRHAAEMQPVGTVFEGWI